MVFIGLANHGGDVHGRARCDNRTARDKLSIDEDRNGAAGKKRSWQRDRSDKRTRSRRVVVNRDHGTRDRRIDDDRVEQASAGFNGCGGLRGDVLERALHFRLHDIACLVFTCDFSRKIHVQAAERISLQWAALPVRTR